MRAPAAQPGADAATAQSTAALSVIVPCYNSSAMLRQCLEALAKSTYRGFDVLVVDDGSSEPLEPIVREHGFRYMKIDGPSGPARARNLGTQQVGGEYVVFIDADVCVHPDTLERFAETFADPSVDAVIGTYDEEPADPGFLSQYRNLFHHYVHQRFDGDIPTFWSGCGAMRRSLFLEFGGFDERRYRRPAIEDIELGAWVHKAGHRIVLNSRVKCKHLKRWTLKGVVRTDIFDRGIPWMRLMLRVGEIPNTLNVSTTQRISVLLAFVTVISLLLLPLRPAFWFVPLGAFALTTLLNLDFYRYMLAHRGVGFTLRVLPMHWLYFFYCGLSAAVGIAQHYLSGEGRSQPPAAASRN
ncbi:MAG: glycosyltransferase family 2 protein [Phycisphaerae bacterium]